MNSWSLWLVAAQSRKSFPEGLPPPEDQSVQLPASSELYVQSNPQHSLTLSWYFLNPFRAKNRIGTPPPEWAASTMLPTLGVLVCGPFAFSASITSSR